MKFISYIFIILFFCAISAGAQQQMQRGEIIVEINNLKNYSGLARVSLYNSNDGFPMKFEKAFKTVIINLEKDGAVARFIDIPYGEYAAAVLHDENKNGKMDLSWMMFPKEGFGASNVMKKRTIPPGFKDARFVLDSEETKLKIRVYY